MEFGDSGAWDPGVRSVGLWGLGIKGRRIKEIGAKDG